MKKNLSFLSKVGVTAASVALIGGLAWAANAPAPGHYQADEGDETSDVWTIPERPLGEYLTGDVVAKQVLFLGVKTVGEGEAAVTTTYVLSNDGSAATNAQEFEAGSANNPYFIMKKEANSLTFTGMVPAVSGGTIDLDDPDSYKPAYLKTTGGQLSIEPNELKPEVLWTADAAGNVTSLREGAGSIYFDNVDGIFKVTSTPSVVSAYIKTAVFKPVFDLKDPKASGDNKNVIDEEGGITTLRYAKYINPNSGYQNATIVLSQDNPKGKKSKYFVEYSTNGTDWTTYTEPIKLGDLTTNADGEVTIYARTYVTNEEGKKIDHTGTLSKTYHIVRLDDPAPAVANNGTFVASETDLSKFTLTSTEEAKASYKVLAAGGVVNTATEEFNNQTRTRQNNPTFELDGKASLTAENGLTVTVKDMKATSANGLFETVNCQATITLMSYYTESVAKGLFGITSTPEVDSPDAKLLQSGSEVKIGATGNAADPIFTVTPTDNDDLVFSVEIKNGATTPIAKYNADDNPTGWKIDGDKYVITLPTGINANTEFKIVVPAGAFQGESSTDVYTVTNDQVNDLIFNTGYLKDQFFLTKKADYGCGSEYASDKTTAYVSWDNAYDGGENGKNRAQFVVSAGTVDNQAAVELLPGAQKPVVTKYNGEAISNYQITQGNGTNVWNVRFNKFPGDNDYLVKFFAGTLIYKVDPSDSETWKVNETDVTAHIQLKEKVDFDFTLVGEDGLVPAGGFCSDDAVYLKVTTKTTTGSGATPDFIDTEEVDGESHYSGQPILLGAAKDLEGIALDPTGYLYTYSVIANRFVSNFTKNTVATADAKVYQHFAIKAEKEQYYNDAKKLSFVFNLKSTVKDADNGNVLPQGKTFELSSFKVKVNGKTEKNVAVTNKEINLAVTAEGVATLYLDKDGKNILEKGTYSFVIPAEKYAGLYVSEDNLFNDPCGPQEITVNFVITDPIWSYELADDQILTSKSQVFQINATYTLDDENDVVGVANSASVAVKEKVNGDLNTVGNLVTATGKISLTNKPTAGTHTYIISKEAYKTTEDDGSKVSPEGTVEVTFMTHVDWTIEPAATMLQTNTEGAVVKFTVKSNPAVYEGTNIEPTLDPEQISVNYGGTGRVFVKEDGLKRISYNAETGESVYEAEFDQLMPNKYTFVLYKEGVSIDESLVEDINTPLADLKFDFEVFKVVGDYDAENIGSIVAKSDEEGAVDQIVTLNLTVKDEKGNVRTNSVALTDEFNRWTIKKTGEDAVAFGEDQIAATATKGKYTVTYPFEAGVYTITAPAGAFKVDASSNAAEVKWEVTVEPEAEWFASYQDATPAVGTEGEDGYVPAKAATGYEVIITNEDEEISLPVADLQKTHALNSNFTIDPTKIYIAIADEVANLSYEPFAAATAKLNEDKTALILSLEDAIDPDDADSKVVRLKFEANAISVGVTDGNAQSLPEVHYINVVVAKNGAFQDSGVKTLMTELVSTGTKAHFSTLTYNRTFGTKNAQTLFVPFDIPVSAVSEYFSIVRLTAITESDKGTVFHYTTLKDDEIAYSWMPYIIMPKATGAVTVNLSDVDVYTSAYDAGQAIGDFKKGYIVCSTTSCDYRFIGTENGMLLTESMINNDAYFWRLSSNVLNKVTNEGAGTTAWSWYMLTNNKNIHYGRIMIDDEEVDGEATGINDIMFNNDGNGIYDLNGRKLSTPQKGINIINGKKVVVK